MGSDSNSVPDLQEVHDFFIEIAKKAGDMITGARPLVNGADSKKNSELWPVILPLNSSC
jgi:myo-inositol-1(or 4)-monophosphatase